MRLPTDEDRIAIVGKTGSGKTIAGLAHLSIRSYDLMPWIIYNFKGDKNINAIYRARHVPLEYVPERAGLYVVSPHPDEGEALDLQLQRIWERGNTGLYIDEGYMIGNQNKWFRTILQQGRSLHIPIISLSQRPVYVDRFLYSEAEFFQVFHLTHKKDRRVMEEYIPVDSLQEMGAKRGLDDRLPRFHSYYYDVTEDEITKLSPVPPIEEILQIFDNRLLQLEERERREAATVLVEQAPIKKVRAI